VPTDTVSGIVMAPLEEPIVTPEGAPVNEYVMGVVPVAVTVNIPPVPLTMDVLFGDVIEGATDDDIMVSVNDCVALIILPLVAVTVNVYVFTGIVPAIVMRPEEEFIVTPDGAPDNEYVKGAVPVAVTLNVPPVPLTTDVLFTDVIVGAAGVTVSVNVNVALGTTLLEAVRVNEYVPTGTVSDIIMTPPVPLMETPAGAPDNEYPIGALPVAVTVNIPPVPLITDTLFSLVIVGGTGNADTISVNDCVAFGEVPLLAVTVNRYVFTATVPSIVIVPDEEFIETPDGAPVNEYVIGDVPVAVTSNVPPVPLRTNVRSADVIVGATLVTVSVNVCVAFGAVPLETVTVNVCVPIATVPAIDMIPFEEFIETPAGWPDR
jgi:hypothetical protein